MFRVYLSLGSNLGDRLAMLNDALAGLQASGHLRVVKTSSIYETEPVDHTDQPMFYNLVAEVETDLTPDQLLDLAQHVEQDLKRTRQIRWGPRTIDIDILLYDSVVLRTDRLTIPHPRLTRRRFVLEPLHEIAPDLVLPGGRRIGALLEGVQDQAVRTVLG